MFEVGFGELLLIFVIALVVLGPERLPKLVSQVGRWAGKARSMARQFREQLESEVNLEELNKTAATPHRMAAPPPEPESEEAPAPHHPAADAAASVAAPVTDAAAATPAWDNAGTYPYESPDYAAAHATAQAPVVPGVESPAAAAPEVDDTPAHAKIPLPPTETHERGF
jgi:sec-independent protein translocase protein TatB